MELDKKKMGFRFCNDCERRKVPLARLCGFKLIFQFIFSVRGLVRCSACDIHKILCASRFLIVNFLNKIKAISPQTKNRIFCFKPHSLESLAHAFNASYFCPRLNEINEQ